MMRRCLSGRSFLISCYTVFGIEGLYKQLDDFAPGWR